MPVKMSNNATSTLAASINDAVTELSVQGADASKFPSLGADEWFPITVVDSGGNMEIMKVTERSGAVLTVVRAQEGTVAQAFAIGARVDNRNTAAAIASKANADEMATALALKADDADLTALADIVATKADDSDLTALSDEVDLKAALTDLDDPYRFVPLGGWVMDIGITGWEPPATDSAHYRYVLLTAGEAGAGEYNEGVLISESVTGSAPLVQATAVIDLATSPFDGATIRLLNTEERGFRPGITPGALLADAFQGHFHDMLIAPGQRGTATASGSTDVTTAGTTTNQTNRVAAAITDGTNGTPRTANETRGKTIGGRVYLRIE